MAPPHEVDVITLILAGVLDDFGVIDTIGDRRALLHECGPPVATRCRRMCVRLHSYGKQPGYTLATGQRTSLLAPNSPTPGRRHRDACQRCRYLSATSQRHEGR